MRRLGVRRQVFVTRLDADTGRIRWRRFVCSDGYTGGGNAQSGCSRNLLTLAGGMVYYNANVGAVAAVRAEDGRLVWLSLYQRMLGRESRGGCGPTPCLFSDGTLFVAPVDSRHVFALDADSGRRLWEIEAADVTALLAATDKYLIASGERLYWIGLNGDERGRIVSAWPPGGGHFDAGRSGAGRGLLAGRDVLWPTRDKLHIFDCRTAKPRVTLDLSMRGTTGGNLLTGRRDVADSHGCRVDGDRLAR